MFEDTFDYEGVPDPAKWVAAFWYGDSAGCSAKNGAVQSFHLRANAYVAGGCLHLRAARESTYGQGGEPGQTYPYSSAVVSTGRDGTNTGPARFEFSEGYAEWRVKFPSGAGLWSGLVVTEQWTPAIAGIPFEIDVVEVVGGNPRRANLSVHDNPSGHSTVGIDGADLTTGFHRLGLERLPGELVWYVDGVPRRRLADPAALTPAYLFMDLQIGTADSWAGAPDSATVLPAETLIDDVRVWDRRPGTIPIAVPEAGIPDAPEVRPANTVANATRGRPLDSALLQADAYQRDYLSRVDGNFTGTTEQILEWAALKWFPDQDPDLFKAMAVKESGWTQAAQGDLEGGAYQSFGLLQVKLKLWCPAAGCEQVKTSTAFAADVAAAVIRAHYDGALYTGDYASWNIYPIRSDVPEPTRLRRAVAAWYWGDGGSHNYSDWLLNRDGALSEYVSLILGGTVDEPGAALHGQTLGGYLQEKPWRGW